MQIERIGLALCLALASSGANAAGVGSTTLGDQTRVTDLFSYPNCLQNCPSQQTLAQTVTHYLQQSLTRDQLTDAKVIVRQNKGIYTATFSGSAAKTYPSAVTNLLNAGDLAFAGAQKLQADGKWASDWRFFLPLGLALTNNPTIELLHFPPDYSLTGQDYLNAKTTERWGGLLQTNGVASAATDGYQAIVDIAPIAAPSDAGSEIQKADPYPYFTSYISTLLHSWASTASGGAKPMVAFGSPVRDWLKSTLGVSLNVDQAGTVSIPGGPSQVPVIGSNHPSMIYYAAYNDDKSENFNNGMKVMRQDLIAACWQASMGKAPSQDPQKVQQSCTTQWTNDTYDVCQLLETTIYGKSAQQAAQICASGGVLTTLQEPDDAELAKIEAAIRK
jgi:hypothetical protein